MRSEQKECRLRKSEKELQGTDITVFPPSGSYGSCCGNWMDTEHTCIETGYCWVYCELNPWRRHISIHALLAQLDRWSCYLSYQESGQSHVLYYDHSWSTTSSALTSYRELATVKGWPWTLGPPFSASSLGFQVCAHCVWFKWCWRPNSKFLHAMQLLHQLSYICSSHIAICVPATSLYYIDPRCTIQSCIIWHHFIHEETEACQKVIQRHRTPRFKL